MKELFAEWLWYRVVAERMAADPEALRRSVFLLAGTLSRLADSPNAQRDLRAKLASLPFVQKLVAEDPAILPALNLPLEPTRMFSPKASAKPDEYVDAVVRALRGEVSELVDLDGRTHAVRPISYLPGRPPYPTVCFVAPDGLMIVAEDFRLQYLPLSGEPLREALWRYRADWELRAEELEALAAELESATPRERLNIMDRRVRNSLAIYLRLLESRFRQGSVGIDDLRAPDLCAAIRYVGGMEATTRGDILLERFSLSEAVARASLLPSPLPRAVVERFEGIGRGGQREVLRTLATRGAAFVPTMHFLRLMLSAARSDEVRVRALLRWFSRLDTRQVGPTIEFAAWLVIEFSRPPTATAEDTESRISAAWVVASEVGVVTTFHRGDFEELLELLQVHRQWERHLTAAVEDAIPSNPRHLTIVGAMVRFVDWVTLDHPTVAKLFAETAAGVLLRDDSPWPLHIDLYAPLVPAVDPLGSIFVLPISEVLERVLGERFTDIARASLTSDFALAVVAEKVREDPMWWHYLRRVTRTGAPEQIRAAMRPYLSAGPDLELLRANQTAWEARFITLAQTLSISDKSAIEELISGAIPAVVDAQFSSVETAWTILKASVVTYSHLPQREERVGKLVTILEMLSESRAPNFQAFASQMARAMRDRLPSRDVDPRISRLILIGRRSV
jgi:hypothetical protein